MSSFVVVYAGKQLAKYGNEISESTAISKIWMGTFLLATITSLPELVVTASSSLIKSPNIAVSDIFGSNFLDIAVIGVLDLVFYKVIRESIFRKLGREHIITLVAAIFLTMIYILGVYLKPSKTLLNISYVSYILFLLWFYFQKQIFNAQRKESIERNEKHKDLKMITIWFIIFSVSILISGVFLSLSAKALSKAYGISDSFFGGVAVSAVTSLPEIVVSVEAIMVMSLDMAVGNLIGSALFNMGLLFIADAFYTKDTIIRHIDEKSMMILSSLFILISAYTLLSIADESKKKYKLNSIVIVTIYILGLLILYKNSIRL